VLADVPTWREQGINVVQDSFRAVMGPKDLTAPQIAYWDNVLGALANSAAVEALTSVIIFLNKTYSSDGAGVRITALPDAEGAAA